MSMMTVDASMDAKLNYLKDRITKLVVLTAEPSNYTDADTTYGTSTGQKLVEVAIASGDITIEAGDPDGRQITVAKKEGVSTLASGTATYIAWLDGVAEVILHYVPTTASVVLSHPESLTINATTLVDRDTSILQ